MQKSEVKITIIEIKDHEFSMNVNVEGNRHVIAHGLAMFLQLQPELVEDMAKITTETEPTILKNE